MRLQIAPDALTAAEGDPPPEDAPEDTPPPDDPPMDPETEGLIRRVAAVEGIPTGDGRMFEKGSIYWEDASLPLPFMALDKTTWAHEDAQLVGQIMRVERDGDQIVEWVKLIASDDPAVLALQKLVRENTLPENSVDLDAVEGTMVFKDVETMDEIDEAIEEDGEIGFSYDDVMMVVSKARLRGTTAVPMGAIIEARQPDAAAAVDAMVAAFRGEAPLRVFTAPALVAASGSGVVVVAVPADPESLTVEGDGALPASELHVTLGYYGNTADVSDTTMAALREFVDGATGGFDALVGGVAQMGDDDPQAVALLLEAPEFADLRSALEAVATPDGTHPHFTPHMTLGYGIELPVERPASVSIARVELWNGGDVYAGTGSDSEALVAAAISAPDLPPAAWFDDPVLDGPTPLTVTDDGRVFGHLALWDSCHMAYTDQCVRPPRSNVDYALFHSGPGLPTAEGTRVKVGHITVDSGHASLDASQAVAKEHYDHTGWTGADVRAGEDRWGIWLAGAARPGLNDRQLRKLLASDVSGDWREYADNLELTAVASVNVPGFPKVQAHYVGARAASLIAALPVCPREVTPPADLATRMLIASAIGRHPDQLAAQREGIAITIGRDWLTRRQAIAASIGRGV